MSLFSHETSSVQKLWEYVLSWEYLKTNVGAQVGNERYSDTNNALKQNASLFHVMSLSTESCLMWCLFMRSHVSLCRFYVSSSKLPESHHGFSWVDNISTRRAIVECRWDPEKYTNGSFLEGIPFYKDVFFKSPGRGEGPRISILMDINNSSKRSLFNKLSLGITFKERKTQRVLETHSAHPFLYNLEPTWRKFSRWTVFWWEETVCGTWLDHRSLGRSWH